jgi:hypothetical protein
MELSQLLLLSEWAAVKSRKDVEEQNADFVRFRWAGTTTSFVG